MSCSKATKEEILINANNSFINKDYDAAVIILKKGIKEMPQDAKMRYKLGEVYLKNGRFLSAEKELKRSIELGLNSEEPLRLLAESYHNQGKHDSLLELLKTNNFKSSQINYYLGFAYANLNNKEESTNSFQKALTINKPIIYGTLSDAYLSLINGERDIAIDKLEKLSVSNELAEGYLLLANIYYNTDKEKLIDSLEKYEALLPNSVKAKALLANAYTDSQSYEKSELIVDSLLKVTPEHPFFNKIKALARYQNGDMKQAVFHINKSIQNGDKNTTNHLIAAYSNYRLNNYEQAYHELLQIQNDIPSNHPSHRIKAILELSLGYSNKATQSLLKVEGLNNKDNSFLLEISTDLLRNGNSKDSLAILKKIESANPTNPDEVFSLGKLQLLNSNIDGIKTIEKSLELDPSSVEAKLILVSAYIETNQFEKAVTLSKNWVKDEPKNLKAINTLANVYQASNQLNKLESTLTAALKIDDTNVKSIIYFAQKSFKTNNIAKAFKLYKNAISKKPLNLSLLINFYKITRDTEENSLSIQLMSNAFAQSKNNSIYGILLAEGYYENNRFKESLDILLNKVKSESTYPYNYWKLLGLNFYATQRNEKSIDALKQLTLEYSKSPKAWFELFGLLEKMNDTKGLLSATEDSLLALPDNDILKLIRAKYLVSVGNVLEAEHLVSKIDKEVMTLPLGQGIIGQLEARQGKFKLAIPKLMKFYDLSNSNQFAGYIFQSYIQVKNTSNAVKFMNQHLTNKPKDQISRAILADYFMTNDKMLAKVHYKKLIEDYSENILALNNLAWIYMEENNFTDAGNYINKAVAFQPNNPLILDTAGMIKLKQGKKKEAKEYFNKANKLAPLNEEIKKHLDSVN